MIHNKMVTKFRMTHNKMMTKFEMIHNKMMTKFDGHKLFHDKMMSKVKIKSNDYKVYHLCIMDHFVRILVSHELI